MGRKLEGKVCLVTGASRGIGKGIALQLGQAGAIVYITGRTLEIKPGVKGSLKGTAREVETRGGKCIPVQCDHSKDDEVKALFERIEKDHGCLHLLVNNAYSAITDVMSNIANKFWEQDIAVWDNIYTVSVRNAFLCSQLAAKMMTKKNEGLIVNISSIGGITTLFGVPYSVNKGASDRLAVESAVELKPYNVASLSLWPGAVSTDTMLDCADAGYFDFNEEMKNGIREKSESIEYTGKCVVHLAADESIMRKTGKVLFTAEVGQEYGFTDVDGKTPLNMRSIAVLLAIGGFTRVANWIPDWLKMPKSVFIQLANHF